MTTVVTGTIHNVGIAEAKVAQAPDLLRIVLGSCVGVALYDSANRLGGIVHIMLPAGAGFGGNPAKFADSGIDLLIEKMINAGASASGLVAKITGGATMFGEDGVTSIGARNLQAVRAKLEARNICIAAEDVGSTRGRKMLMDLSSGVVTVECIGGTPRTL